MRDSLGYTIRRKWDKKKEDLKQDRYSRQSDILYKRRGGEKVLFVIMFIVFALFSFSFIFSLLWVLLNSFKTQAQFGQDLMGWPNPFTFNNFIKAFSTTTSKRSGSSVFEMLGYSVFIAGVGTIVTVFTSSIAGYVVAKY